ncbi:hypothetical protein [Streptomyces sp. NBC_01408]|uniref:hypothetical protein n=1 Tax=Streptomyces sp. NBC_01408 TaxID=2903855 RepID=UPI0022577C36|nr:hypothetical protein [Streptomyces sp. NBC_01408]MCX4696230.1 hypothetical protein [Streptomyces sp. NBC_01408]
MTPRAPRPADHGRPGPGGRGGGPGRRPGAGSRGVRARFRVTETPGVTVTPGRGAGPASAAAHRALVQAGLGHLGGHLRLDTYGPAPRGRDLARAARRAVTAALAARPRPGDPYRG